MVIKFKVSDVAKDFGKNNKDIINILSEYCDGPAKKANTVLEERELDILVDKLTTDNSVSSFDAYYNSAKDGKKPEKKKSAEKKASDKKPAEKKANDKKPAPKPEKKDENKKHQSQAAILQMAEQAAKRAGKGKEKSHSGSAGKNQG